MLDSDAHPCSHLPLSYVSGALGARARHRAVVHRPHSTEKYVNLTGTSRATAYRELTHLAEHGLLAKTGQGRGTRYALVMPV